MCRDPIAEIQCRTASDQNQKILGEGPEMREGRTGCQGPEEPGRLEVQGSVLMGAEEELLHKIVHHSDPKFN